MADQSNLRELYRVHAEGQHRYVYFLLAASGAALGYGLQKLDGTPLSWGNALGVVAVVCWLLSFLWGCKRITAMQNAVYANYAMLQLKHGVHPEQPPPQLISVAAEAVRSAVEGHNAKANKYFHLQFRLLGIGTASFVLWRLLVMVSFNVP